MVNNEMSAQKQEKLWSRSFVTMLVITTFVALAYSVITPILTGYVTGIGISIALAGIISGIFPIAALVIRPFTGITADKFGKKHLMISSTIALAALSLCCGYGKSAVILILLRILGGFVFAFSSTTCNALSASFIPRTRLGEGIGILGVGFIVAFAIGPSIGQQVAEHFGYTLAFYVAFIINITAILLILTIKSGGIQIEKNKTERQRLKIEDLFPKKIIGFALLGGMFSLMSSLTGSFLLLLGKERSISEISLFFIVNSACLLLIRPFSGKLLDRKSLTFILLPGFILTAGAALLIGFSSSLWTILLAAVLYAFGAGASQPALQASCVHKLGPKNIGVATSTYYFGADLGQGIGPIIGGIVIQIFGYRDLFYIIALLFAAVALFYSVFSYHRRKRNKIVQNDEDVI